MDPIQTTQIQDDNKLIPINEATQLLKISSQTLKLWEKKGLIKSTRNVPRGMRFYKLADLKKFPSFNLKKD